MPVDRLPRRALFAQPREGMLNLDVSSDELTKVILSSAPMDLQSLNMSITIQEEAFEVVERFTVTDEVNAQICKANLRHLCCQTDVSLNRKGLVYQATVRIVWLCGCET
ncbi:hypothetical protein T265_05736 [Opisthorchis viverrini]|uniref:Uncharacterized protein n=1 Tax=Opisthorchis viverrini TaxID=6198 RepID=A0A075AEY9_OPIVI|nr:hypothetical protein T265_05736 [Opisthorchis viverrini]KER27204.1 hypothetical protein T265_05736 [Opisthorchis viverrini]